MPKGVMRIRLVALRDVLMLPENYTISHIRKDAFYDDILMLVLESPDIPEIEAGPGLHGYPVLAQVNPFYVKDLREHAYVPRLDRIQMSTGARQFDISYPTPEQQELDRAELTNKQLEYLKVAHPESAESIQSAQDFRGAMLEIQAHAGESSQSLGAVSEAIKALAKEQEA